MNQAREILPIFLVKALLFASLSTSSSSGASGSIRLICIPIGGIGLKAWAWWAKRAQAMSVIPEGFVSGDISPAKIRQSASIVTTRDSPQGVEILFCHRVPEMPSFPDFWAFPGGGITRFDRAAAESLACLTADDEGAALACLMREMVEEVGWAPTPEGLISVGEEARAAVVENGKAWHPLVKQGEIPCDASNFSIISIRTTPPLSPMRFENRFFHLHDPNPPEPTLPNGRSEFDDMRWMTPLAALSAWENSKMRLPPPQVTLLRDLIEALQTAELTSSTTPSKSEDTPQGNPSVRIRGAIAHLASNPPTGEHQIEFAPGVECVPLPSETLPPATHTNCYILGHSGGDHIVVDPAARTREGLTYLTEKIRAAEKAGGRIIATLFTHRHPDHIGDLAAISKIYQAPIWATADTHEVIPPCDSDRVLVDGDILTLEHPKKSTKWKVLVTPGHCPGHVCLESEVGIVSGDMAVMVGTILVPPDEGDMDLYIASLERLRDLHPPILFPSHGPLSPVPERLLSHYISHRNGRHQRVLTAVKNGLSDLQEIADFAYADTPDAHPFLKVDQTLAHLRSHARNGAVLLADEVWKPVRQV